MTVAVDTSALIAILFREPESEAFSRHMLDNGPVLLSAASLLETRMVLHGRNALLPGDLDDLLKDLRVQVEHLTQRQSDIAFDAFRRYGKGTGHRACLNFGDCFAYALARERGAALLFKGDDFVHTDVTAAA